MTQIIKVPIDKLTPDPTQPRQRIYEEEIVDLAKNIENEGIINPIEVDSSNVIITGERRWRAAKLAGLTTVPCFVNDINPPRDRFKHQLSENIHHNTMSDLDTAIALDKVLKDYGLVCAAHSKKGSGGKNDKGVFWLSEQLGKSRKYIDLKLALLDEPEDFQKAVNDREVSFSMVEVTRRCPDKFKKAVRGKIINQEFGSRTVGRELVAALEERPDKAAELLKEDYSNVSTAKAVERIRKIAPGIIEASKEGLDKQLDSGKEITEACRGLRTLLAETPVLEVSKVNLPVVMMALAQLKEKVDQYMEGQEVPLVLTQSL
jgi:ParB family transcriptional regulator, chromosome partitioning protein